MPDPGNPERRITPGSNPVGPTYLHIDHGAQSLSRSESAMSGLTAVQVRTAVRPTISCPLAAAPRVASCAAWAPLEIVIEHCDRCVNK